MIHSIKSRLGQNSFGLRLTGSRRIVWILVSAFLITVSCQIYKPWLHIDRINTEDFETVRAAVEPDLDRLIQIAEQKFEDGDHWYEYWFDLDGQSANERYGVESLCVSQVEADDGTTPPVLFVFTVGARNAAGGYYYTPSGILPFAAPTYGVVCSKHVEGDWYAFNTADSSIPPDPERCPEDNQYSGKGR